MKLWGRYIGFGVLLTLSACWGEDNVKRKTEPNDTMSQAWPVVPADTARIITLPTPMQIPAILRNTRAHYEKELLCPILQGDRPFFKSNLLFGAYMIDLAYAASFSDRQTAIEYFNTCRALGDDMGLKSPITESMIQRFNENIERPDSLGRIILEIYDRGHTQFRTQGKEGVGLLMVMGCLVEGLHFTMQQAREHDLFLFLHLLNEQRDYCDNLMYALGGFEIPSEVQAEFELFSQIQQVLHSMRIPSAYRVKQGLEPVQSLDEVTLSEVSKIVEQFRESMRV